MNFTYTFPDLRRTATLNYVNSFPVDAVRFGIQTLAPEFFKAAPDFVVSGPNIGSEFASLNSLFDGTLTSPGLQR